MATAKEKVVNKMNDKIMVRLPMLPEEGGGVITDQNVVVTINGSNIVIPRGISVEVTPQVYEVLYNSHRFEMM